MLWRYYFSKVQLWLIWHLSFYIYILADLLSIFPCILITQKLLDRYWPTYRSELLPRLLFDFQNFFREIILVHSNYSHQFNLEFFYLYYFSLQIQPVVESFSLLLLIRFNIGFIYLFYIMIRVPAGSYFCSLQLYLIW